MSSTAPTQPSPVLTLLSTTAPDHGVPGPTAPDPTQPAIELVDVHKSFGSVHAVNGLSLSVRPGEVLAFLGPNGAGKSTTLDMVLGFSSPSSGEVRVLGTSPSQAVAGSRVSAVLQDGGLLPDYTVAETLTIVSSLQAHQPDVEAVVRRTALASLLRRKVSKLSGGERQRLRLALALLPAPELLVLDEPTTGMDVTARAAFWDTMRQENAGGARTIVFATHYLQEAADFADRIVIIDHGRLVADGTIDELRAMESVSTVTATWPDLTGEAAAREALAPLSATLTSLAVHGEHLEIRTSQPDDVARLLLTTTPARHLGVSAPSLDDIFSDLVTGTQAPAG